MIRNFVITDPGLNPETDPYYLLITLKKFKNKKSSSFYNIL